MSRCIVNVAVGAKLHYFEWQTRLLTSLDDVGYDGGRMFWTNCLPEGSPTHEASPYAMKPAAFRAAEARGHSQVLWCDSAIWARRPLDAAFDLIEKQGYLLFYNGFACGNWITDDALEKQGLTRDEAMTIPDFTGCCMGLDVTHPIGAEFLRRWHEASLDGVSFVGDWNNDRQQCSTDPRCRGHRHDQVIGSIIAHRMGMTPIHGGPGGLFSYWREDMAKNPPELESICLVNNRG